MSAKSDQWDIHFAYPAKTDRRRRVWRTIETTTGTEPEANKRAESLYVHDGSAVDFIVVPSEAM